MVTATRPRPQPLSPEQITLENTRAVMDLTAKLDQLLQLFVSIKDKAGQAGIVQTVLSGILGARK